MAKRASFCVDNLDLCHCYVVKTGKNVAQVWEVYGVSPQYRASTEVERVLRCELPRSTWDAVSRDVALVFNRRIKELGLNPGKWGDRDTPIERLLGKELLCLLWAIEAPDVSKGEIQAALRNWMGLKPEERWWLCAAAQATTGRVEHRGIGWRGALRIALCHDSLAA